MSWVRKFESMRRELIGDIIGYIDGNVEPETVYLVFKRARPDSERPGYNRWGSLGFARGNVSLQNYQNDGWELADPRAIRKGDGETAIRQFVDLVTKRLPVIGN